MLGEPVQHCDLTPDDCIVSLDLHLVLFDHLGHHLILLDAYPCFLLGNDVFLLHPVDALQHGLDAVVLGNIPSCDQILTPVADLLDQGAGGLMLGHVSLPQVTFALWS